ncbi:uncharacterized protein LOC131075054 isoform X1 [Cryptomeria japonica]|uniref:uncharacterized protein LOC131075054 isoform X1 n=1 Tax=Cryptomeria japonica TaxID=3369 RepID=UPI0027DA950D|nr:uncharacterized protein LOC131075054 isoform X1 [Cryptomeria japonica]
MVQFVNNRTPESTVVTSGTTVNVTAANNNSNAQSMSETSDLSSSTVNVKVEIDAEDGRPPSFKRPKFAVPHQQQQWSSGSNVTRTQAAFYNPLNEPSPLGLTLRKTPSLLDLIQMKLSQEDPAYTSSLNQDAVKRKDARSVAAQASADKLKASNFPVSVLRIGTWECISRYEGDLVAKCYFAKHKLVWEVLDGGLKSKIEIQWSDITALKASCPENEAGTIDIEVSRPPLFFRETNPQPRKHTLWQATSDFTGGQATICRRHFLQCPQGLLNRHYEKLIQCDARLSLLSKKPFPSRGSPFFDARSAAFHDQNEQSHYGHAQDNKSHMLSQFDHLKNEYLLPFPQFPDMSPPVSETLVPKCEALDSEVRTETTSPSSVMDSRAIEDHGSSDNDELNMKRSQQCEQLRLTESLNGLLDQGSGLLSTSMSNLVSQIGIHFQEQQRHSCSSGSAGEDTWSSNKRMLDEIAQHLLSDSLLSATSDEQSIIARVNSMCCLLQKDVSTEHLSETTPLKVKAPVTDFNFGKCTNEEPEFVDDMDDVRSTLPRSGGLVPHVVENNSTDSNCQTVIPRKESSGDLLLHLPRVASLPQFFIHSSDELATRNESNGTVGGGRLR